MFFNCKDSHRNTGTESDAVKTITLTSLEESFQDTAYFKKPQIIVLETTDESLLSDRIARIVTDDSLLFVYDDTQEQVFVFDISGKYLHKIDRKGQGPGEYVQNCDFTLDTDNKQIILSVDIPSKFMYFTYDCRFIKEENLPYLSKLVKDDTFIYGDNYMGEKYQIEILDTESEVKKERLEMMDIKNYAVLRG
ncbi:MAG: 6-bladed beta-propeller, partial [Tannerella sp.]|nr:6-bladed beta-propeller [Tannerella sp.]